MFGLAASWNRKASVPRQSLILQCLLVELGFLGPEQSGHPVPWMEKLGPLESQSAVPRQSLDSQRVLVKLGLLGLEEMATVSPLQQP